MTIRALSEVFIPGAAALPERLRTLTVTPTRFVEPGTTVEATFGFYNSGGATATGLRVRFSLPEGLVYIPGSARIDGVPVTTTDDVPDGAFVALNGAVLGEIGPNVERQVTILYRVAELIEDGTTLALQAAIAANETQVVGSNIVRLTVRSRPLLSNAQTSLTIEAPSGPEPGRELLIRARVTNLGQSSANEVVLGLPLPEHTRYSARSARIDGRPIPDDRGAPFEISATTVIAERLAPGESAVADFIAVIESPLDNATPISAIARISARECPEFEIVSNDILVASMPSFDGDGTAFLIAGDDEVVPGMRLRMTVRAANVGTSSARRVIAQLTMPTGLVYSPGSATLDGLPLGDELFAEMAYTFESVAPGRTAELSFDAVVVAPAPPDAKLPVAAKLTWENGERQFKRVLTIRSEPRFTRVKNIIERAGPPLAQPNEEVSFIVHVVNEGTAEATEGLLRLRLDKTLSLVSAQSAGRLLAIIDDTIALGALPPHIEQLITVVARTTSPIADRSEVALGAELETRQLGAIDLGIASYTIRSRPRFSTEDTRLELRSNEPLRPSRSVQVALHISNTGTDVAKDVHAIFSHAPEIRIEPLSGAPLVNGELIFDSIPPGTTREALIDVRLIGVVPNGTSIALEARLETAAITPLPLAPIHLETRAEAEFAGEIELVTTPADAVDAGAPLMHTLRFRNVGDGPAQSIVVRVRPPDRVVYVPASTIVNDMRIDDEGGSSPLWALHGLILTDVDPGVPVNIRWEAIVMSPIPSGTLLSCSATLQWDEQSLTVTSHDVVVRSSPEFASSPGGRSISIARLAARSGQDILNGLDEPQALPRPRPVASVSALTPPPAPIPTLQEPPAVLPPIFSEAPTSTPAVAAPRLESPPPTLPIAAVAAEPDDEEFELPFFSAPPSLVTEEEEEIASSFTYAEDDETAAPIFAEPPSLATPAPAPVSAIEAKQPEIAAPPAVEPAKVVEPPVFELPPLDLDSLKSQATAAAAEDVNDEAALPEIVPPVEPQPTPEPAPEPEPQPMPPAPPEGEFAREFARTAPPEQEAPPATTPTIREEVPSNTHEQAPSTAPVTILAFAPDRLRRALTFLQQSDYGKLVSHLFALEAFFPDSVHEESQLDELFIAVRDAFRSTLDRLFVRLRLPRYAIAARDLEDRSSRDAVTQLVEHIAALPPRTSPAHLGSLGDGIRIQGSIDHESLEHALTGLHDAPIGGVTPWIACVSLLGTTIEVGDEASDALATYRNTLLSVLRVLETLPTSEFHRVLTSSTNAELDAALHEVIRILGGQVEASAR